MPSPLSKPDRKAGKLSAKIDDSLQETVIGDALRLRQLLGHLIANSIRFTQRGEVGVSAGVGATGDSGRRRIIRIRDTGVGIPAEQLANIFERFWQLETVCRGRSASPAARQGQHVHVGSAVSPTHRIRTAAGRGEEDPWPGSGGGRQLHGSNGCQPRLATTGPRSGYLEAG